jgi:heat shock protein HtpX
MRFFEHQRRARQQSQKLTLLFSLLITGQVVFVNLVLVSATLLVMLVVRSITGGVSSDLLPLLPPYFLQTNTAVVLLYIFGGWWIEASNLSGGGEKLAQSIGAKKLGDGTDRDLYGGDESSKRQLFNIVQELAIASNMHAPSLYVLPRHDAINAFTAGWDDDDSIICVTQGALERLEREEMMGLIAHELSHIREGDTRLNMRLAGMVLGLELIYNLGQSLIERRSSPVLLILGYLLVIPGWINWLCARLMKAAISREREFLADAGAVQFTRSKDGLGQTLRKIVWQQEHSGEEGQIAHPAVQHMLLVDADLSMQTWLQSHPPLAERIRRIYGRPMPKMVALPQGRKPWQNPFASS